VQFNYCIGYTEAGNEYKHQAQDRKRLSLEGSKRLTRLRFVLVLLSREDVKAMTEKRVRRHWHAQSLRVVYSHCQSA